MDFDPTKPGDSTRPRTFETELEDLINRYSQENGSDTPDFILAAYLMGCLKIWNDSVSAREQWYGRRVPMARTITLVPETDPHGL